MYECWWRNTAGVVQNGFSPSEAEDEAKDKLANGGLSESGESLRPSAGSVDALDFDASLLLSESHAAFQATQRRVKEIQERLAAMVLQHSRAQGGQLSSGEERDDGPSVISSSGESPGSQDSADAGQR